MNSRAMYYFIKLLISAGLIVAISEIGKRTGFWGALLASLPLISLLSIGWIYYETRDIGKICAFSTSVFWLVIPSLAFFIALPASLQRYSFEVSMALSILATLVLYIAIILLLPRAGIRL